MEQTMDLFGIFSTRRNWFQRLLNSVKRYFAFRGKMTVKQYLEKYGTIQMIDKESKKAFYSDPAKKSIGGIFRAGDIKRIGIF